MSDDFDDDYFELARSPMVITSGDPAGIGPEITHKAIEAVVQSGEILSDRPIVVIGDAMLYAEHLRKPSQMHKYQIFPVEDFLGDFPYLLEHVLPDEGQPWRPVFLDCGFRSTSKITIGKANKESGDRAVTYLGAAVEMLADDMSELLVTAPINKEAAQKAGFPFPGHTEMVGHVCDEKNPVMMLVGGGLRVALVTVHEPLAKVSRLVSRKRVRHTINVAVEALQHDFGIENPRVAVCGLNPHAGENGNIGNEEKKAITPVIQDLEKRGLDVTGPHPADSVFYHAKNGAYDVVIAMYHDQGLVPLKTLAMDEGVNITIGLPVVRTSPDHGTALDIAGRYEANATAMINAVRLADELARTREGASVRVS